MRPLNKIFKNHKKIYKNKNRNNKKVKNKSNKKKKIKQLS